MEKVQLIYTEHNYKFIKIFTESKKNKRKRVAKFVMIAKHE